MDSSQIADETQVCRCDEILAGDVRQAIRDGATTLNDVKRVTRAGMGACQGIFCMRTIAAMLHDIAGVDPAGIEPMTSRPPVRMIALEQIADTRD